MTSIEKTSLAILVFSKKLFSFNHGALAVIAAPSTLGLAQLFKALIGDTPLKDMMLPIALAVVVLVLYFIVFVIDFISGVRASKKEANGKPGWFKSSKGWSSILKMFIVTIVVTFLAVLSSFCSIAKIPFFPTTLMLISGIFGIMATLFDLYSIGENQLRLTGKKDKIFILLENLGNTIEKGLTTRITNWFSK